jgi:NADH:ubiquinone oxidoreductase subunit F (NADH-binding)
MNTEPEFLGKSCPPCNRDCREGRDCPARMAAQVEDDDGEELGLAEMAQVGTAVAFALCVLGGLIVVAIRGCSA